MGEVSEGGGAIAGGGDRRGEEGQGARNCFVMMVDNYAGGKGKRLGCLELVYDYVN